MGRMGIRAGKLTSPEFFDKEVLVLLVRNMCESFDKNGKTKCAHKCFTQSKGFILSEQISHLLNCAMENNRKRKLQYLSSHVMFERLLAKHRYRSASLSIANISFE